MLSLSVSLLIAAVAYYFFLDEKVTKNQDKKILPRSGLYLLALFFVGPLRAFAIVQPFNLSPLSTKSVLLT